MTVVLVLDAAGRRRSPATLPGYLTRRRPAKRGPITTRTLYVWSMATASSARRRRATSSAMS